ncbi:Trk system potassium transporter TrkA [Desulfogranum japonicum]|uniref:Trk system potassium transporter TrkA n=1 Tax=Desulfogranum japonicum TaxID=231447 RepID=UPI001E416D2C|nr:Trk system potassium transporter TrkA [Desulfogranum japonicum]
MSIRVREKIHYPILLVSQLGNVIASMAQYGQYGTLDAMTLPNRYPKNFWIVILFRDPNFWRVLMRILIYGATEAGYMVALRLHQDHDVTLLDEQERVNDKFGNLDISFVEGSGADVEALIHAGAGKMDLFIACSGLDEANVVACWTVKKIVDIETVCFVGTMELYNNLVSHVHSRYQTPYDIDTVIWPEQLLTHEIFRIVSVPEAIDVEYFSNGRAKLFEYRIKEDSFIRDCRVMDCAFPENVLIVGITRDHELFIPDGSTKILQDDKVVFMGTGAALDGFAAQFFQKNNTIKDVVVIGGGNVGFLLTMQLEQAGLRVKLIERSKERCTFLADNLKKTLVLNGDGTDLELLEGEALGEADVTICVTDNDEKNLLCSLLMKQLGSRRIITRVSNERTAQLFERVGIDVVVSPRESAMRELMNRLQSRNVNILAVVEGGQGEVLRVTLAAEFPETKVKDIHFPAGAVIGVIQRGRQILIPKGETSLLAGDMLKIFTKSTDADAVKAMFNK